MENKEAEGQKGLRVLEILIAEDNEDDIELARIAFRRAGGVSVRIHAVKDGEEVLKYVEGKEPYQDKKKYPRPDLILLDIRMPKMDGLEALKIIKREDSPNKMIPVTMLTSSANELDIVQSYNYGAASYFKKPVTMDEFVNLTANFMSYWRLVTLV